MHDSNITVGPYQPNDEAMVVALWQQAFPNEPPANEPRGMIARKLRVQPELFLVAREAGAVVGALMAGFDGVRGWLHHLAVLPSARRRGIAGALVRAAESKLQGLGCPKVNLQVRADNSAVVAFYESLGYATEERLSLGRRL
ncbi:MAG: GNAT family acetyltransferase [Polyangiaceae bacterium]